MNILSGFKICACLLVAFSGGGSSYGQTNAPELITPFSSLVNACVDTPPVGDGFGWDGMCTCRIDAPYQNFGAALEAFGDTLVIGAREAPRTCAGSGSATVYQLEGNKSPAKVQEVIARARDVEFINTVGIAVSDDFLAVSTADGITIFMQIDGAWVEDRVLPSVSDFSNLDVALFVGEYLLLTGGSRIVVYTTSDWTIKQTIIKSTKGISALVPHNDGFIAAYTERFGGQPHNFVEFFAMQNGSFSSRQVFTASNGLSYDLDDDLLVIGKPGPLNINRIQENTTFRRDASGQWTEISTPFVSSGTSPVRVIHNQLILRDNNNLLIHRLDPITGWAIEQTLRIGSSDRTSTMKVHQKNNNRLLVTVTNILPGPKNNTDTIAIVERGSDGTWRELVSYDHKIVQSSSAVDEGWLPDPFGRQDGFISTLLLENRAFVGTVLSGVLSFSLEELGDSSEPLDGICDYSNAIVNDGWGWDSVSSMSCPPQITNDALAGCDYRNADINDGWGWNPITGSSCEPQDQVEESGDNCDYSNASLNGGWGWNPIDRLSCDPRS